MTQSPSKNLLQQISGILFQSDEFTIYIIA